MNLANFYIPLEADSKAPWSEHAKIIDENWKRIEAADDKAKAAGLLEGRYITFPQEDGQAVYIVTTQRAKTCLVEVVTGLVDDWVNPILGRKGSLRTTQVQELIQRRDNWKELMKGKKQL